MIQLKYKTTKDIKIANNTVDQVLGQDNAIDIIKKSAKQRRHVLLIGEPGTGKSMIGMALAELLPKEKLVDIVAIQNESDENVPLIKTFPKGQASSLITKLKLQAKGSYKNQAIIMLIIIIFVTLIPYYFWKIGSISDIIYAASMITSMVFLVGFILFINLSKRIRTQNLSIPNLIIDNSKRKTAPFIEATGAHAGALLGDVLHDPFQTFFTKQELQIKNKNKIEKQKINKIVDLKILKNKDKVLIKKENNYKAAHFSKNELFILGEIQGSVSPVEVLSCNKYDYNGEMIKLTTSENKELIITPKHKIAILRNGKIEYIEAKNTKESDEVVTQAEGIIIDEQDIINSYSEKQQKLAKSYYDYLDLRKQNPTWSYKRIATKLGVSYGRTRWWWEKNSAPIPIQTVECLKNKKLIPLKINDSRLPIIAKIIGATFGDGGIFDNLNGVFLSSSERGSVEEFGRDLELIFGLNEKTNSRVFEGGEKGHSWCYQNTNRCAIRFLLALGAPKGNKTKFELKIPGWIKLKECLEDEFFGSFLGGELGTPIIHKHGNYLTTLEVGITGLPYFKDNRISFLKELSEYLNRKNIKVTSIYEGKTKTKAIIFRLLIEKKLDNVLNFMAAVKINYCRYKVEKLYRTIGQWAQLKRNKYDELLQKGYGAEHIMKMLNLTPNSLYLLLNHFESKKALT